MTYNLSLLQNLTGLGDLVGVADTYSGNILFLLFIIAIFVIIVMVLKRFDFAYGITVGGWVCFLLSGILAIGGFINPYFVLLFLVIGAFGALYLWARGQ